MSKVRKQDALDYHSGGKPGKIEVIPTKPYASQRDLSLAYSPGVAEPCLKIAENIASVIMIDVITTVSTLGKHVP